MREPIIALDFSSGAEALAFVDSLGAKPFVKVGMELFYSAGQGIVTGLKKRGLRVFLDLKLHDIPNTVRRAMAAVAALGADMVNVHAAGGIAMMQAALEGAATAERPPMVIAVTQLTSTSEERLRTELLIDRPMRETVAHYAANARTAGLAGVVCSPLEAREVHAACGEKFLTVTPGIRFAGDGAQDQSRVTTPAQAYALGADYIVIGRSVTGAADPAGAFARCVAEFSGKEEK